MDTKLHPQRPDGRGAQAAAKEFARMAGHPARLAPQELSSIPDGARAGKGKLLISEKNWEQPQALHEGEARFVAMGNVCFDKRTTVVPAPSESPRAPAASLIGARFAQ
eukprot:9042865-Pyramimonas_sp.AAC.1